MKVIDVVSSVRSKNAGPFWVTIDIFCGSVPAFNRIVAGLTTRQVGDALGQPEAAVKRFDIASLHVVKFSVHRPVVQGHPADRDLHGAQWAVLIEELVLPDQQ
ncbi:MAG: DUF4387 family protein [Granulosicoccus sp.]|nr:DUF4387 family protein [Granulosicoccus sp.]